MAPAPDPPPADAPPLVAWSATPDAPAIRVGIQTDVASFELPRIPRGYVLTPDPDGTAAWSTYRGLQVSAPASAGATVRWAVQVSATPAEEGANELARALDAGGYGPSTVLFDAAAGLYKVLAGDFPTVEDAQRLSARLGNAGYPDEAFVTKLPARDPLVEQLLVTDDEGNETLIDGRTIWISSSAGDPIAIGESRYRGVVMVYLNDRALLNVVNVLNLEDYVKGVVPNEMGPRVYDQIEALKAQALAARTYAVSRMGQFDREGFDICPTAACQVYEGFSTEHELSNRAVEETAGLIITYEGKPIDALYTSTCGGATSDVDVMFPGRSEPYLRAADCVELALDYVAGRTESAILDDRQVRGRILRSITGYPDDSRFNAAVVSGRVKGAAQKAGLSPAVGNPPSSVSRRDVLRHLATALGWDRIQSVLLLPEDRVYFFPHAEQGSIEAGAAAFINKYLRDAAQPIERLDLSAPISADELDSILLAWLEAQGAIQRVQGKIHSIESRTITLEFENERKTFALPSGLPIFRQSETSYREHREVPYLVGDRVTVIHDRAGTVAGLIIQANYDGAAFDRTSSFSSWIRSFRANELVDSINRRHPITSLSDLRILSADQIGRISAMEFVTGDGSTFTLRGLPVRWGLNVPDNLFAFMKSKDPDGVDRYTFYGKGWGHGTGMCQVGAYGMALRGHTAEQIVEHYYTGAQVAAVGVSSQ